MFKVNNKDTRIVFWTYFSPFSSVDFDHVFAC